jgi:hypothetical protein
VPLSEELRDKVRRLQSADRARGEHANNSRAARGAQNSRAQKHDEGFTASSSPSDDARRAILQHTLEPPREFSQLGPMRLSAPSTTSSTWSGGDRLLSALAQGPHHLDFSLHDDEDDDEVGDIASRSRSMLEGGTGTGTTWPPVGAQGGASSSWWSTMRQIHVLSVLELERQIGLPRSLGSRGSLNTDGSSSQPSSPRRQEDTGASLNSDDGVGRGVSRNPSLEGVDPRSSELRPGDFRPSSRLSVGSNEIDIASERTSTSSHEDLLAEFPASPRGADVQSSQVAVADSSDRRGDAPDEAAPISEMQAADVFLFDTLFNLHPFAAAAFLRAFIACSFGLTLFHVHTFMSWPDHGS